MQIAQNNLAPPKPLIGQRMETLEKGSPDQDLAFRSVMSQSLLAPMGGGSLSLLGAKPPSERAAFSSASEPNIKPSKRESPEVGESRSRGDSSRKIPPNEKDGNERGELKIKDKAKDLKSRDAQKKNGVVQKFMDSLESELGITAERFSAALAQLPDSVKSMPIKESAPFVIAELGVPVADQASATNLYLDLVQNAGFDRLQNQNQAISGMDSNLTQGALFDQTMASSLKATERQKLNATIDEMNRRFFNVGELGANSQGSTQVLDGQKDEFGLEVLSDQRGMVGRIEDSRLNAFNEAKLGSDVRQTLEDEIPLGSLNDLESFQAMKGDVISFENGMSPDAPKFWSAEELPFLVKKEMEVAQTIDQGLEGSGAVPMNSIDTLGRSATQEQELSRDQSQNESPANQFFGGLNDFKSQTLKANANSPLGNAKFSIPVEQRVANIDKLSNATEALAAKGGGEMKIILAPEGLGTVQLKVKMQDGKLKVELQADNHESRQILESSLSELKSQLSSNRLAVDSVKVDVAGDFTRQDTSQSFTQQQFDMGREQARQFMNQFREGNLSQRQSLFEAPGFKTYRGKTEDSLNPISTDIRPRSSLSAGKGREINLVA